MTEARLTVTPTIRKMVRTIVARFHPERVILFGSRARGGCEPDSDVDLLVVLPVEGSERDMRLKIRRALRDVHVPKDIMVTRPEEFAWRKDVVGTLEYPAAREGKTLYVKS